MSQLEVATFREFAALARVRRSYVTQLKQDGRLVLTEDGRQVRVAESLALIEATRDPSKRGVAARHAAARASAGGGAGEGGAVAPAAPAAAPAAATAPEGTDEGEGFQYWRQRNEKAKALASERENALAEAKLLEAAQVEAAVASAGAMLRMRLESLPATLGPQLTAMSDEGQVVATLAETIEHLLDEVSRQFAAIGKGQADG